MISVWAGVQVIPNVQSLTADYYRAEDRGKVFGTLHLTSAAGAALGGLYATNVGAPHLLPRKRVLASQWWAGGACDASSTPSHLGLHGPYDARHGTLEPANE